MKVIDRISVGAPCGPESVRRQQRNERCRALRCGAITAVILVAGVLAGCGGSSSGGGGKSFVDIELAYSRCIRSHGVSDFPDPNKQGNLVIQGKQQVSVNFDMRELTISGIIRPQDIDSTNSISYNQIAEARIEYGGKGQIADVQQPRYGDQLFDILMPF